MWSTLQGPFQAVQGGGLPCCWPGRSRPFHWCYYHPQLGRPVGQRWSNGRRRLADLHCLPVALRLAAEAGRRGLLGGPPAERSSWSCHLLLSHCYFGALAATAAASRLGRQFAAGAAGGEQLAGTLQRD